MTCAPWPAELRAEEPVNGDRLQLLLPDQPRSSPTVRPRARPRTRPRGGPEELRRPAATASWIWAAPIHAWHSAPTWRASSSSSTCGGAHGRALQLGLALHGRQQRPGVPAPCLPGRRAPARRHRSARWWDRRVRAELGACGIFSVAVDSANRLLWMGMGRQQQQRQRRQRQQISTAAASRSLRVTYILAPLDRLTPLAPNPSRRA